ncbi:MAG TPA: hypothetical protein VF815_17480 [Myxococcaceae bacterium]|jgi:hypothetical protein
MSVKVVVAKGSARIELEGPEDFVNGKLGELLPWIEESKGANGIEVYDSPQTGEDEDASDEASKPEEHKITLGAFIAKKSPQNVYEAMACVLFFSRQFRDRPELSTEEIRKLLIQGKFRPPGSMAQAMTDGRRKYGYVDAGSKKGLWKLSRDGEVTVEIDLPRTGGNS